MGDDGGDDAAGDVYVATSPPTSSSSLPAIRSIFSSIFLRPFSTRTLDACK